MKIESRTWYEIEEKHPQWGWRKTVYALETESQAREESFRCLGETRIVEVTHTRKLIPSPTTAERQGNN